MQSYFSIEPEWAGDAVFIIGGGPSIKDFDLSRLRGRGRVIAINNAGTEPDRAPWADVLFWADQRWYDWNADKVVNHVGKYKMSRKPNTDGRYDVKWLRWLPQTFAERPDSVGGWCGGSSAMNIACHFGARVQILLGFDMKPGNWHNLHLVPPIPGQHKERFIPNIERFVPHLERRGVTVINTNPRSALRCFPFADIEEILAMDDIAKIERAKYLEVWQRPEYRVVSPGMNEAERASFVMRLRKGMSLYDFGAGPARATLWFQNVHGIKATAIDFAPNARETDVPFIEANLWELPETLPPADVGYCCDVMEHIPPEQIAMVLHGIVKHVRTGCYFRIATRPDHMGPKLIGKPLHMTVQPWQWWRDAVETAFDIVDVVESSDRHVTLWARV